MLYIDKPIEPHVHITFIVLKDLLSDPPNLFSGDHLPVFQKPGALSMTGYLGSSKMTPMLRPPPSSAAVRR